MKNVIKPYEIIPVILIFALAAIAEYRETFSMLEDQTIFLRHGLRTIANKKEMSFAYDKIVLVNVDDIFYDAYGQYPLKRADIGKIIFNIHALGAKVICVDFLFNLPDAYGEDLYLAEALKRSNTMLASQAIFEDGIFQKLKYPTPVLKASGVVSGYVNLVSPSSANTFLSRLRIHPEIMGWEDGLPFSIQIVSEYLNEVPVFQNQTLTIGDATIELDQFNDMYIDFSPVPKGYRFLHQIAGISAYEFMDISELRPHETKELEGWVRDKIVIIGDTTSMSNDWFDTPMGMIYGSEIIADTVSTILKGTPLRPVGVFVEILAGLIFMTAIISWIIWIRHPLWQLLGTCFIFSAFVGVCAFVYVFYGIVISMTYNLIAGALASLILGLTSFFREKKLNILQRLAKEKAEKEQEIAHAANLAKSRFLANMSHEIRTPMNAILGFAQLVANDPDLAPEHRKHLGIVCRSGEHLLSLINEVLDMSKIEARKMTINENDFDLYRLLDDLENILGLKAEKKSLSLIVERTPDVPRHVRTDEIKLRQVLINLIGNAIKFTKEGGISVRVRTKAGESESFTEEGESESATKTLCFEIEDSGLGISPEETEMLFQSFVQTETGRQSQEGTGLGLPISRKFVQLMGGDITVRSDIGKGTLFAFDIRIRVVGGDDVNRKSERQEVVALEPGQPRYKLLIAEDNPDSRHLLVKLLEPLGFQLREAVNGREAVDIWREWRPELVWMDIRMPVMDGKEAIRKIRELEKSNPAPRDANEDVSEKRTVIIALTAETFEEERSAVLETGCDDFLRKPFRTSELFELMGKHAGFRFVFKTDDEAEKERGKRHEDISSDLFAGVPGELIKKLRNAALGLDVAEVEILVKKIRDTNPDLANILDDFAYNYDYLKIIQMIGERK